MVGMAAQAATILSGVVALIMLIGAIVDILSSGWVRRWFRRWSGIEGLRRDHHVTQTFLSDLGKSHNELADAVCDNHDIENIPNVNYLRYRRLIDEDDDLEPGDFVND